MKLKELLKKASEGYSNTIYSNIDKINGKYKVFEIICGEKYYHFETESLQIAIDKMESYKKNGFPKVENKEFKIYPPKRKIKKKPKNKIPRKIKKLSFIKSKNSNFEKVLEKNLKIMLRNELIKLKNINDENVVNIIKTKYGSYTITKTINEKYISFGSYKSFNSALLIKKYLEKNNWNINPQRIKRRFSHFSSRKSSTKKKKKVEVKKRPLKLRFKSDKYYNRVDPIVYDPSMTYIPKSSK